MLIFSFLSFTTLQLSNMSKSGYLIKHGNDGPHCYYFTLEDGVLSYANSPTSPLAGFFTLTGYKVTIASQHRKDGFASSFSVSTQSVIINDQSFTLGSTRRLELSAVSAESRQEWGNTLFSWQRYYFTSDDDENHEQNIIEKKMLMEVLHSKKMQNVNATQDKLLQSTTLKPFDSVPEFPERTRLSDLNPRLYAPVA